MTTKKGRSIRRRASAVLRKIECFFKYSVDHSGWQADGTWNSDPIHKYHGNWWFWNETWADRYGPYPNERTARERLNDYIKQM